MPRALTSGILLLALAAGAAGQGWLRPGSDGFVLQASLASLYFGRGVLLDRGYVNTAWDAHLEVLNLGGGHAWDGQGFTVSTRVGEVTPGGSGDYMLPLALFPVYVTWFRGLGPRRWVSGPVAFAYAGYAPFVMYDQDYVHFGAGVKWTFHAVSPTVQASCRVGTDGPFAGEVGLTAGVKLEVGGWWPVGKQEEGRRRTVDGSQ